MARVSRVVAALALAWSAQAAAGNPACAASYACTSQLYGDACVTESHFERESEPYMRCLRSMAARYEGDPIPAPAVARRVDPDSLEGRLTSRYGERCAVAYTPGTGAFGQCLLAYADRDEAAGRAMLMELYRQQQARPPIQAQMPAVLRPGAVCTTVYGNQLVSRPCF